MEVKHAHIWIKGRLGWQRLPKVWDNPGAAAHRFHDDLMAGKALLRGCAGECQAATEPAGA